jgi:hypothetical protein
MGWVKLGAVKNVLFYLRRGLILAKMDGMQLMPRADFQKEKFQSALLFLYSYRFGSLVCRNTKNHRWSTFVRLVGLSSLTKGNGKVTCIL